MQFLAKKKSKLRENEVKFLKFSGAKLKGGRLQALIKKWGRRSVGGGQFFATGGSHPPGKPLIA